MHYFYLAIAIIGEIIGTSALKASIGFTKLYPSLLVIIGYSFAFYFFSLAIKVISVGIAYAIWAGLGIVLIAITSAIIFKQIPDLPAIFGMVLIISGVVIIQLYSKTIS